MRALTPLLTEPPLDPSGDEARRLLRRELADPDYYDADLLDRLQSWLSRLIDGTVNAASGSPLLSTIVAVLVALALVAAVLLIVSRARRTAQGTSTDAPALTDEAISAQALRQRAESAYAAGDWSTALVDAFRATAVRQIERDRIEDLPQATAHELARALGAAFADHAAAIDRGADLFDVTLYGERAASQAQAQTLLELDDLLAGRSVRR